MDAPGTSAVLAVIVLLILLAASAAAAVAYRRFARLEKRAALLERELEERRREPLEGELVIVTTPKPDDRSMRGLVSRVTDAGALVLTGTVYLETQATRGGGVEIREVPAAGVTVVPSYSRAQIVTDVVGQAEDTNDAELAEAVQLRAAS